MSQQQDFLKVLFNPGESICLTDSKYDVSIQKLEEVDVDKGTLCCINPLNGTRCDENVSAFRSFLIEVDSMGLYEQKKYIEGLGVPFSSCVFSGNKSLHYSITLDEDLPSEKIYRYLAQWILNIVKEADQNCKNPSRSIRFPGNARPDTCKIQKLVDLRKRISLSDLYFWLGKYEVCRPVIEVRKPISSIPRPELIAGWAINKLTYGLDPTDGRNRQWYAIFFEFAKCGYSEEQAEAFLQQYFIEEPDFKRKEWLTSLKSAYRNVLSGVGLTFK
jgi:hypothetical protein